jgi:hypothetical protein
MINNKLQKELAILNISLTSEHLYNDFSDYLITHEDNLIAFGWIVEDVKTPLSFNGYAMPNFSYQNYVTKKYPSILDGKDITDFFQFYLSDTNIWYAPPINVNRGFASIPISNTIHLINDINLFIENNYKPDIFRFGNYNFKFASNS